MLQQAQLVGVVGGCLPATGAAGVPLQRDWQGGGLDAQQRHRRCDIAGGGQAQDVRRDGGRAGDDVWVSGELGMAAAAASLNNQAQDLVSTVAFFLSKFAQCQKGPSFPRITCWRRSSTLTPSAIG